MAARLPKERIGLGGGAGANMGEGGDSIRGSGGEGICGGGEDQGDNGDAGGDNQHDPPQGPRRHHP
nr:hypothetical protein [Tanacetum cinerariifolium]